MKLAIESVEPGASWATEIAADRAAIDAKRTAADAIAFQQANGPLTADLIAEWTWRTGRHAPAGYDGSLAADHASDMIAHPAYARLCRGREALDDIRLAAGRFATPTDHRETHAEAQHRAGEFAVKRYKAAIARQLSTLDGEIGAAGRSLVECDELEQRIGAAVQRLEQAAASEVARVLDERRGTAAVTAEREAREAAAATEAAEAVRQERRLAFQRAAHEERTQKARALILRLQASGLKLLRVGADGAVYDVADLIGAAHGMTLESLAIYESALNRQEASR